ncbi:glycosyltransferase family 39 protein [Actinomycetota bacterium Odt1-20B]
MSTQRPPARVPRRIPWLALVALAYAAVQLTLVAPHLGLGWDETVYLSQVDPHRPAAYFSAPRSRGITFLTAPVLGVTGSITALRTVLALLSAAALYAAYRCGQPLLGHRRTALAALLFAGLWASVLYGSQAMPNLWMALSALAAAGWFLRAVHPHEQRRALIGLGAMVAAATCFRFSDGAWLALSLLAACAAVSSWRRPGPALAVVTGFVAGGAEWITEAYLRWGGVGARLHASSAIEGGMGLHWAGGMAWRSLNGPLLCRPCQLPLTHPAFTLWWLALPVLALLACVAARHSRDRAVTLLPVACALALSIPYLLLIDYSAPRFLLPAYALLSPPLTHLAALAARVCRPPGLRILTSGLGALLLALHLATQYPTLVHTVATARAATARYRTAARDLHHLGLTPPCLVSGTHAPPIGYYADCASANVGGNNRDTTSRALLHRATKEPTATLTTSRSTPPSYARNWSAHPLPGTGLTAYAPSGRAAQAREARR